MSIQCQKCGAALYENDKFCGVCGATVENYASDDVPNPDVRSLEQTEIQSDADRSFTTANSFQSTGFNNPVYTPNNAQAKPKKNMGCIIAVIVVVAIVVILFFSFILFVGMMITVMDEDSSAATSESLVTTSVSVTTTMSAATDEPIATTVSQTTPSVTTITSTTTATTTSVTTTVVTTTATTTTAATTTVSQTTTTASKPDEPIEVDPATSRDQVLYECIVAVTEYIEWGLDYRYKDNNGELQVEVIDYYNTYDEDYPQFVSASECYEEDGYYYIQIRNFTGSNAGAFWVDINTKKVYTLAEFENRDDAPEYGSQEEFDISDLEAKIEFTVKNRVFGDSLEGRKVDVYFDGEKIGSVKASSLLITSEEDFSVVASPGKHTIEFRSTSMFSKDLYSKWEITISDLGAYMDVKLSADDSRIDAEFSNQLSGYLMMDGMYYIEEIY